MTINIRKISLYGLITILIGIGAYFVVDKVLLENNHVEIIVINKCDFDVAEFWKVVYVGMNEAIESQDLDVTFMNASFEYEIDNQKRIILQAIELKPDIIVLSASDYYEIAPLAQKIVDSGINLLLYDSDVERIDDQAMTFVGTNSLKAGEYLGRVARGERKQEKNAIILVHFKGVQTSDDREKGIRDGYGEEGIIDSFSCRTNENVAYRITLEQLKNDDRIESVFATNEIVTIGAAKAIKELGLSDSVNLYGFDSSKEHVKFLEMGIIDKTIIQSPYQMGYLAMINSVNIVKGKPVDAFIETDFLLIDEENMYELGYREILFPFTNKN